MLHIPRKAESFSSLSRMLRSDIHLKKMTNVLQLHFSYGEELSGARSKFLNDYHFEIARQGDANKFQNHNDHDNKTILIEK